MKKPWWMLDQPHEAVVPYIESLEKRSRSRTLLDYFYRAVYEGRPFRNIAASSTGEYTRFLDRAHARLNASKSVVDTVTNRLIKRRALPIMTATDADWTLKTRARRMSRYVRSLLAGSEFDSLAPQLVFDAAIVGTGVMQIVDGCDGIRFERVPREELLVEPRECRYNTPRQIHRKRQISRWVLMHKYDDKRAKKAIEEAPPASRAIDRILGFDPGTDEEDDQIDVWESWHLPSSDDSEDGLHTVCIAGATLHSEEWKQDVFPFPFLHWTKPASGFWGRGLVEEGIGLQVGLDRLFTSMINNAEAMSGMHVFLRRGSAVPKGHVGGPRPRITEYDGATPPQFVAPTPFNPAMLSFAQWVMAQLYELSGVSQASAQSRSPLGNGASGVALDNMMDIESDRFGEKELSYSMFRLDVARSIVAVNKQGAEAAKAEKRKRVVTWDDKDVMRSIDWNKVDMRRDQFAYRLEPTNFIPETRSGKISTINELGKIGVMTDPAMLASLFDEPDMDRAFRMQNAPMNAVESLLEQAADVEEDYPSIDPHMDPQLIVKMGKQQYNRLLANHADRDERGREALGRVRDVIELAQAMIDKAAPPEQPAAPPMPPAVPPPAAAPPDMGGMMPPGMM